MPRKRGHSETPDEPPRLTVSREELERELSAQIEQGNALLATPVSSESDLRSRWAAFSNWGDYNRQLLRSQFTTSELADEYSQRPAISVIGGHHSFTEKVEELERKVTRSIRRLESIRQRLPLYKELSPAPPQQPQEAEQPRTIFVVHGHDAGRKNAVARFLEKLTTTDVLVLHEQPNRGRTVIEKFEGYARTSDYAVVILTGDDRGGAKDSEELLPRARQNVVFELGFFIGALDRAHVAVLYEEGVELPSDIGGLAWIELDTADAWQAALTRELVAAGVDVDFKRAL